MFPCLQGKGNWTPVKIADQMGNQVLAAYLEEKLVEQKHEQVRGWETLALSKGSHKAEAVPHY